MPHPTVTLQVAGLESAFDEVRAKHDIPERFPDRVNAEAKQAASAVQLPERDETSVEFITIDPEGAMDLDQALHIERLGGGYRVRYAIADVPAFVRPGTAMASESIRRGMTIYCPDTRVPLHPPAVSEAAASLLPDQTRPALIWDLELDAEGEVRSADVYRAAVRSRRRYDYHEVQRLIDDGSGEESLILLAEVGRLRIDLERERGGATLPMPEQRVKRSEGRYALSFRPLLPAEDWNAQISLMTGMTAADMMLHAEVGIVRTMPEPRSEDVARFRRQARAVGVEWQAEMLYGDFLRSLDPSRGEHLFLIHEATMLFRGAGYTAFTGQVPELAEHAAIAAPYAHVTAPLRRLVDRFALEVCVALSAGEEVPEWVLRELPGLPDVMAESDRRSKQVERECLSIVEAAVLQDRIGEVFEAMVVDLRGSKEDGDEGFLVQLADPAVVAHGVGRAEPGESLTVRLREVEVERGRVTFERAEADVGAGLAAPQGIPDAPESGA